MVTYWRPREHLLLATYILKWLALGVPAGAAIGTAVAIFLWALDGVTRARWDHAWLSYLLPAGGVLVAWTYQALGREAERGNNLIIDEIHQPGGGVPARMAPLVLVGTLVTHLFGGSAGREGTAVQMGGSMAATVARWLGLKPADVRTLLTAGVAGGFGAVFGTPLTGAVFAIEVLAIGRMSYEALIPCLIASVAGDWACTAWNVDWGWLHFHVRHTAYSVAPLRHAAGLNLPLLGKVAVAAVAFGLASVVFAGLTHGLQRAFKWASPAPLLRPVIGGVIVIALAYLVGPDYLGLGVTADPHHPAQVSILSSFHAGGATPLSWWWKILFTAVTLGSGFKGGEVTPLFFVGAALGNAMAGLLGAPPDLFAALGFVSVFAGATNTPLACTIMGVELFGGEFVVYVAAACFLSYALSGHSGIYASQRIGTAKIEGLAARGR